MDELKKRFSLKKRHRPQSPTKIENILKQKYIITNDSSEYIISIKLVTEKNNIIIKCSNKILQSKFEANFELEELKQKNRIFNVCQNLEDAFKIFTNFFNLKKVRIEEDKNESVNLILIVPNYIENIEENISFNLIRSKKDINEDIKEDEMDNNKLLNKILQENNENKLGLDLIQKISDLSKNNIAKENDINIFI